MDDNTITNYYYFCCSYIVYYTTTTTHSERSVFSLSINNIIIIHTYIRIARVMISYYIILLLCTRLCEGSKKTDDDCTTGIQYNMYTYSVIAR